MEITTYFVAGIDVHKRMLAVVVADAGLEGEFHFEKRQFGATPSELKLPRTWLSERGVRDWRDSLSFNGKTTLSRERPYKAFTRKVTRRIRLAAYRRADTLSNDGTGEVYRYSYTLTSDHSQIRQLASEALARRSKPAPAASA